MIIEQPLIESIEHLDHGIVCEGRRRRCGAEHVDFYVDQHRCDNFLLCSRCVIESNAHVESVLACGDSTTCTVCLKVFRSLDDLVTVVPL